MSHFAIKCRACGKVLTGQYCAFCEHCKNALLVTDYNDKTLRVDGNRDDIWKFNWLPVHGAGAEVRPPAIFKSEGLANKLGLRKLYIAFNGYWKERGANLDTCTFKEYEAAVVLENAREGGMKGLVVASAGNTARAFAHLASITKFPTVIVVPLMCLEEMWYLEPDPLAPTFVVTDGDYSVAIDMARRIAEVSDLPYEGGVKNIAKRDGLGIPFMAAVHAMGRLPEHYFQAVGSGAGAVAVYEMIERLRLDDRFKEQATRLHLAQNLPFVPMTKAWWRGQRELEPDDLRPELISHISTRVLSTRYPAYTIKGGVYDALTYTDGITYGVTNNEIAAGRKLFEESEGMDIVLASGAAVAALVQAVEQTRIAPEQSVLLNITGGGESSIRAQGRVHRVKGISISKKLTDEELKGIVCEVLKNYS